MFTGIVSALGHIVESRPLGVDVQHGRRLVIATPAGYLDDVVLLDSTPVECGRSVETSRRSALAPACAHHYSRSHSRWFWGMRLHLLAAPDGTPRAAILSTISNPEVTVPKTVYPFGSGRLESPWTRKNWPPLPFSGSAVRAIATVPRGYEPSFGAFSTAKP